ncbi:MAG: hypothetical protein IKP39_00525 [Paludibacteraceae bacterium]|nr:hypothetical protein [Paludibacteraceae bacterium]
MKRHWIGINKEYVRALCALGLIVAVYTVNGLGLPANATEIQSNRSLYKAEGRFALNAQMGQIAWGQSAKAEKDAWGSAARTGQAAWGSAARTGQAAWGSAARAEKDEIEYVSINASKPTEVKDTTYYRVQDGWNYLQFAKNNLPATIAYIPDTAFGPIPKAFRGVDQELGCMAVLYECQQGWIWQLEASDQDWLITIEAHEEATIWVMPSKSAVIDDCEGKTKTKEITEQVCDKYNFGGEWITESGTYEHTFKTVEGCDSIVTLHLTVGVGCGQDECEGKTKTKEISEQVCDKYTFGGQVLRESGTYEHTFKTVEGCDSIVTLHLTVGVGCGDVDIIYFCKGMNTEHLEGNHWYKEYEYESPATWFKLSDYQVGGESERTLMDLRKANADLRSHYVDGLTPVEQIIWSHRNDQSSNYTPVEVANEAQWIAAGVLALRVLFLCGESYSSDFATDVVNVNAAQKPVKTIENGQVVIIRGGEKYNILGTRLR